MANYNEANREYACYQQQISLEVAGYMPDAAAYAKLELKRRLYQVAQDATTHEWVRNYFGVLHHLDAFLLSVERIVEQIQFVRENILNPDPCPEYPKTIVKRSPHEEPPTVPPALIGISSVRIEVEAETILLRAAGLLERLSKLIGTELGVGVNRDNFGGLEARLMSIPNDDCARELLRCFSEVKPLLLKTVLADPNSNTTNLRNTIAHRASSPEIMDKGFTINWLEDASLLAFDAELGEHPLVATVRKLAQVVPYYTMESIRLLLYRLPTGHMARQWAESSPFHIGAFEPAWRNPFIHYSSFIDETGSGPIVSLLRWLPGGFQTHQRHLRDEVMSLAVRPINAPASEQEYGVIASDH